MDLFEREIRLYGNYFSEFYAKQSDKVKDKIDYVIDIVRFSERVPEKFFKHLSGTDGLYEVKVSTVFKNIRIFCFFDAGNLIILTNCFVKKSQKTPKKELVLAIKLKEAYFKSKKNE